MPRAGTLVYLYGPPAVGKLTVATELQRRTQLRLFHNHLTVDALTPVFDFGGEPFTEVLHRVRLDVFATAARAGIDVIFTNNSVWAVSDGRKRFAEFADTARERVEAAGGRVVFVQLTAPLEVLEARVGDAARRSHGKLRDPIRLRTILQDHDLSPLAADHLMIDTSVAPPAEAAERIIAELSVSLREVQLE
jgi:chloramphenicol 3-O-phosphotransferase